MLKRYLEYIKEDYNGYHSFGEWVESLMNKDDIVIRNIVSNFTQEIDPSIKLSNAINILDKNIQSEMKRQINNYLKNGVKEAPIKVNTIITDDDIIKESDITISGKGVFASFLKVLTSLKQKEIEPNWEKCPNDFLIYYYYPNLETELVKNIFNRFKSLNRYVDYIDYQNNELDLYCGIRCDGNFEYGIRYTEPIKLGVFKLTSSAIRWLCQLDSKSAESLKKEIVNLKYTDIITLGQIKKDMLTFNPGYHEQKSNPILKGKVISFGYYGVSKWNDGKIEDEELIKIKNSFTKFILSKKWGSKILISVNPKSFWVFLNIKLK